MRQRICFFSLLFLFFGFLLFGQEDGFVHGTIIDDKTNEPVVFATVRLKGKALGVISNQDGSFRVPQRFMELGEILIVSCLGYKKQQISLSDLSSDISTVIRIEPEPVALMEAVLVAKRKRPPTPRQIIKRALEHIPRNYPTSPFSYVGYYRDYQLKGDQYVNLNEAILNIVDKGFEHNDLDHTAVQIYDYNANLDFRRDSLAIMPYNYATKGKIIKNAYLHHYGGNELNILRIHDAIRNYNIKTYSYVNRLNKDLIKNHSLSRGEDVMADGERMYVIELEKNKPEFNRELMPHEVIHGKFRSEGTIFISKSTYAIHKLVYRLYDTSKSSKANSRNGRPGDKLVFEVTVEYKRHYGKMYLNYISFHNVFTVRKSMFYVKEFSLDMEKKCFVITFNKDPILVIDKNQKNFLIRYKKKKVRLIDIRRRSRDIFLYPELGEFNRITEELSSLYVDENYYSLDIFEFSFMGIMDSQGNYLHQYTSEEFNQFREYFTQQITTAPPEVPASYALMKKDRPIFEDQPIIRPDNFNDFWMNTPLKTEW